MTEGAFIMLKNTLAVDVAFDEAGFAWVGVTDHNEVNFYFIFGVRLFLHADSNFNL